MAKQRKEYEEYKIQKENPASGIRDKKVEAEVETVGKSYQTGKALHEIHNDHHAVEDLETDIKEKEAALNNLHEEECELRSKEAALREEQRKQEDQVHFMNLHTSSHTYSLVQPIAFLHSPPHTQNFIYT